MFRRSLLFATLLACTASSSPAESLDEIFKNGKAGGQLRAFWYDGDRERRIDRTAMTVGGILSYETAPYQGVSTGASFFSSNGVLPVTRMPYSGATHNLNLDGSSINTLGEAYVRYTSGDTVVRYGRQRLDLPLANDYYNRMLPNSFEALYAQNKSIPHTTLKAAFITGWKYKASDTFVSPTYSYGADRDIGVIGAVYAPDPSAKIELYDTYVRDFFNAPYLQLTDNAIWKSSDGFNVGGALQYMDQKSSGSALAGEIDTYLLGLKATVSKGAWNLSGLYTRIGDQTLLGTGGRYEKMGWGGFITFTDLQIDGESENAGAEAYGAVLTYRPDAAFEISAKTMHIDQSDSAQHAASSLTPNPRPDSDEYNLDATYHPSPAFRLRTRLARIDYAAAGLFASNAYDETNLRIIADCLF